MKSCSCTSQPILGMTAQCSTLHEDLLLEFMMLMQSLHTTAPPTLPVIYNATKLPTAARLANSVDMLQWPAPA
jgi:hypothetical protein